MTNWFGFQTNKASSLSKQHSFSYSSPSSISIPTKFWKFIWSKSFPPRLSVWLWKVIRNKRPSKDKLIQKRIFVNPRCVFCQKDNESLINIFGHYPNMVQLWTQLLPNNIPLRSSTKYKIFGYSIGGSSLRLIFNY